MNSIKNKSGDIKVSDNIYTASIKLYVDNIKISIFNSENKYFKCITSNDISNFERKMTIGELYDIITIAIFGCDSIYDSVMNILAFWRPSFWTSLYDNYIYYIAREEDNKIKLKIINRWNEYIFIIDLKYESSKLISDMRKEYDAKIHTMEVKINKLLSIQDEKEKSSEVAGC